MRAGWGVGAYTLAHRHRHRHRHRRSAGSAGWSGLVWSGSAGSAGLARLVWPTVQAGI